MKLNEAKVLVTGGSSGIGLETARRLQARGARVAICGRQRERLDRAAADFDCVPIQADVGVERDVVRLVETVVRELDGYNVLINNAAYGYMARLTDIDLAAFERMMAVNLTGTMLVGRESARHFVEQGRGNIINVGSSASRRGYAAGTPYVASKFALRGMTECWRAELRPHDVRVMQVDPSEVLTGFAAAAGRAQTTSERKLRASEIAHMIVSMLEMDDRGFTTEVAIWATNPD